MTQFTRRRRRRLGGALAATVAVISVAVAFAAIASGASSTRTATPAQIQATVNKAFMAPVPVASLDPTVRATLARAANPLTQAQLDKAYACWKASGCTLGDGKVTIGIADGYGDNAWRKFTLMENILQAMTYPEVGKIIYTNAHGSLATFQANLRNLTAQGAKAILLYNDYGFSAASAFTAAQKRGSIVSVYASPTRPVPGIPESAVAIAVNPNYCTLGGTMADETAKAIGKTGGIAFFTGAPGNPEDAAWQKCAEAKFKKSYPGIKVTYRADTDWTPAGAFKAASALIASGKEAKAILYSYSHPVPKIIKAYIDAGKPVPAIITYTSDNGSACAWKKATAAGKGFTLYQTSSLNWAGRVSVTATLAKLSGKKVPATISVPWPFSKVQARSCISSFPDDYPGSSTLIPLPVIKKMLGG